MGSERTPSGQYDEHERFARAVDTVLDGVAPVRPERPSLPRTNGSLGRHADEQTARDLAVVALLRRAAGSTGPDSAARQRMRQRILDGLNGPQPYAAPQAGKPAGAARANRARAAGGGTRPGTRGGKGHRPSTRRTLARLATAAAIALSLVVSLSAAGLLFSKDALPGQQLYAVKRSAETASIGMTFGDEPKAHKYLEFASARVDEIEALTSKRWSEDAGAASEHLTALADFDPDATAASQLLTRLGTAGDSRALGALRDWAQAQSQRLTTTLASLPPSALSRTASTLDLLARIQQRSVALLARIGCPSVSSGAIDDVGLLPATDYCARPLLPQEPSPSTQSSAPPTGINPRPTDQQAQSTSTPAASSLTAPPTTTPAPAQRTPALPGLPLPRGPQQQQPPLLSLIPLLAPPQSPPPTVVIPLPLPTINAPLGRLGGLRLGS